MLEMQMLLIWILHKKLLKNKNKNILNNKINYLDMEKQ